MGERLIQIAAALTFALILISLAACDGDFERRQAESDWNAKMSRAATPEKGQLVTIRQYADGRFVVRRYEHGLISTDLISRDDQ